MFPATSKYISKQCEGKGTVQIKITNSTGMKQRLPVKRFRLKLRMLFSTKPIKFKNVIGPEVANRLFPFMKRTGRKDCRRAVCICTSESQKIK